MSGITLELGTPLAEALSTNVQTKLVEVGWSTDGLDDSALSEYIILMLVNGKTEEQIAAELSSDLLSLPPDDTGAKDFAKWLWNELDALNRQIYGQPQTAIPVPQPQTQAIPSFTGSMDGRRDNKQSVTSDGQDAEMGEAMDGIQSDSIPTGPKSMRNGGRQGNKRLIGQISKAMDRSHDAVLHRVRAQQGTERIGMQIRQPPKGPRGDMQRQIGPRPGIPTGPGNIRVANKSPGAALMQMSPQQQMQLFAIYEQQARMMAEILSPQQQTAFGGGLTIPAINPAFRNGIPPQPQQPGRSLFDRIGTNPQRRNGNFQGKGSHVNSNNHQNGNTVYPKPQQDVDMDSNDLSSSMEVEASQNAPAELSPDTTCKFNLKCTKPDCMFAHQSPAAPPGTSIDVNDHCPFGAACKNRKCVARHPSPAQKVSHQSEQDCKFFPNCTNSSCPFKHPTMPLCRNGADCTREGCKFTHSATKCKFNPCTKPSCQYQHEEGQKKEMFGKNVWAAAGSQEREHVSERKFVVGDEGGEEELIMPDTQLISAGEAFELPETQPGSGRAEFILPKSHLGGGGKEFRMPDTQV